MLKRTLKVLLLISLFLFFIGCPEDKKTLKNPEPPFKWNPFDDYPLTNIDKENNRTESFWNTNKLDPELYRDKFFNKLSGDAACLSIVRSLTVNLTGQISGNLRFNQGKRMLVGSPELNNDNKDLGGVYISAYGIQSEFYKYEVVIDFDGLEEGFYGQMISGCVSGTNPQVEFSDDSPENDWDGLNWNLGPGEKKEDYPVFEVDGDIVRWIDAPQARSPFIPCKNYVIVYAGACGTVTHMQIIEITYPSGSKPTARTLSKDEFRNAVSGWTYKSN
jgi:hypothetical protein